MSTTADANSFDALLIVSFGGPEKKDDVVPFLRNVTAGRNIPEERLQVVAEHYYQFGGKSPINDQTRALQSALEADFRQEGIDLPIYWGNRNWHPMLGDAISALKRDGKRRVLAFIVSAYGSYSGCRQYRENITKALEGIDDPPVIQPLRRFFNHPSFVEANASRLSDACQQLQNQGAPTPRIVFTAHSIPTSMANTCDYEAQLRATAAMIASSVENTGWDLVWQSRSGPPQIPWLAPDILEHLRDIKQQGCQSVVLAPIGFLSDHMEVAFDLDVEAKQVCDELQLPMTRALTVGTHPSFIRCIRQLVLERLNDSIALGTGPMPSPPFECRSDCCPAPVRRATAPTTSER